MMANAITIFRMAASIVLLFCPVFSPIFYALYLIAGLSDMVDGIIARKTNSVSEFGSRFDSIADFVFVAVCLIKILPVMCGCLPDKDSACNGYSDMAVCMDGGYRFDQGHQHFIRVCHA